MCSAAISRVQLFHVLFHWFGRRCLWIASAREVGMHKMRILLKTNFETSTVHLHKASIRLEKSIGLFHGRCHAVRCDLVHANGRRICNCFLRWNMCVCDGHDQMHEKQSILDWPMGYCYYLYCWWRSHQPHRSAWTIHWIHSISIICKTVSTKQIMDSSECLVSSFQFKIDANHYENPIQLDWSRLLWTISRK